MECIPDPVTHPIPYSCRAEVLLGKPCVLRITVSTDNLAVRPYCPSEPVRRISISRPELHDPAGADGPRGEFEIATGCPSDDWESVLGCPRLHLDQNRILMFGLGQVGQITLDRVVHPPAHAGTPTWGDGSGSASAALGVMRSVMITIKMAEIVMAATVRYPVPGGSSQSRSLKPTMIMYASI